MNLPGVAVSAPALTTKDRADAEFAAGQGVDFLALSFVRTTDDIGQLRALLDELGHHGLPIIAKIEKPEALDSIEAILDRADGIMVARGDLGVEMPAEEVPLLQNELVRIAIERNRPVIVATQMLESMIDNARPTRAEVTDVASAAMARTDAVMLSAETAVGRYPIAAVEAMDRILRLVEGYQLLRGADTRAMTNSGGERTDDPSDALSRATSLLSSNLDVRAIVVPTRSGRTARLVAAERPSAPVVALALDDVTCRRLSLLWGVTSQQVGAEVLSNPRQAAVDVVQSLELAADGQTVLLVWDASSSPSGPGLTSQIQPTVSILSVRK
jgi:pyruvate kinase